MTVTIEKKDSQTVKEPVAAKRYIPTEAERHALDEHAARKRKRKPCPNLRFAARGPELNIAIDHPDRDTGFALVMQALGSTDSDFVDGLITQLANASSRNGQTGEEALNFMLAVVKSIAPQDEIESMLAAQMAAVHMMVMNFTSRLANASTLQQQDSAERALNKLARTFATQVEALKRYRTGGQQKMTVEHVHVHEGGQAIVGHVEQKVEGGTTKKE
ncbi:MAG: hypothetical protein ACR2GC_07255 [Methyloceanibacter sp.]|uniref:hypothetical protein n=1 Tax=Methyloceanibacter sp. TaxID=1965321 RepID=UPI003D9BE533